MTLFARCLATVVFLLMAGLALAQETVNPTTGQRYEEWQSLATQTELMLDRAEEHSVEELEEMRRRITGFRPDFASARGANADRIETLEAQLNALGPPPESGSEPEGIANQRKTIDDQLEILRAPVRVADSEFRRSEGLIGEIDRIIRARQARKLLSLGPSPIDPRTWPVALEDIERILSDVRGQVHVPEGDEQQDRLQDRLPLVVLLVVMSLPMILRGRKWAAVAIDYMRSLGGRGTGVWSFLASLLRIFIPLAGVYILSYALSMSGLFGAKVEQLLRVLPLFGLILLGFRWMAERLFAREDEDALLPISTGKRRKIRSYLTFLSLLFVMRGLVDVIFGLESALPETIALLSFPLVVMIGTVLVFMGMMMRKAGPVTEPSPETPQTKVGLSRVTSAFGTAMIGIGLVAPVMAGLGYAEAGNAMLYPTTLSFLLLGLVVVLQRFFSDVYGLVTGQGVEVRDGLAAISIGFLLTVVALPILALIWGARVADLTELWTQFLQGFDIGGTRISPSSFLTFVIVFIVGYTITRLLQSTLRQNVLPKTKIDIGGQNALISGLGPDRRYGRRTRSVGACHRGGGTVRRHRLWSADHRVELRFGHHPAGRTADLGRRLDRSRRTDGLRQAHLGAFDPDRDLRPDRRNRP
jgi:small-conductance mechanosensitive channel